MVFFIRWGLGEVIKRRKTRNIGMCNLDYVVGWLSWWCWGGGVGVWRGEIENLWYWVQIATIDMYEWGFTWFFEKVRKSKIFILQLFKAVRCEKLGFYWFFVEVLKEAKSRILSVFCAVWWLKVSIFRLFWDHDELFKIKIVDFQDRSGRFFDRMILFIFRGDTFLW